MTTGKMSLVDIVVTADSTREAVLRIAGALEDASEHPIAKAIARGARDELGGPPAAEGFTNREGLGVEGIVDGHGVQVGRPSLMTEWSLRIPPALDGARRAAEQRRRTAVLAAWDGEVRALLAVVDTVKPTSAEAITRLKEVGLRPVLLTGDNIATARAVAAEVGISRATDRSGQPPRGSVAHLCTRRASAVRDAQDRRPPIPPW